MIEYLFGENSLFPRYKLACKNKDSREAKEAIKRGEFVENSHLWDLRPKCFCQLEGCLKDDNWYTELQRLVNNATNVDGIQYILYLHMFGLISDMNKN